MWQVACEFVHVENSNRNCSGVLLETRDGTANDAFRASDSCGSLSDNLMAFHTSPTTDAFDAGLRPDPSFSTQPNSNPAKAIFFFAVATLLGTLMVIASSGWTPWVDALSGAFAPVDIAQDVAAARLFADGISPYGTVIREMHARVVNVRVDQTFPYFPHPPFSLLVSWYSAYVSFETAALIWFSVSVGLLFLVAALLAEILHDTLRRRFRVTFGRLTAVVFVFLLCWPPALYNLEKGQWSILLTALVCLGWRSLSRRRMSEGGAWIGLAAAVKVFPVVLGGYFLMRSRKALVAFLLTGAVATAIPLAFIGFDSFFAFVRQSQSNLPHWETFPSVTVSLHGALARFLIGGTWARPLVHAPVLARALDLLVAAILLACAAWLTVGATQGRTTVALAFSAWAALLPVMNPQSLGHNAVLLALPFALTLERLLRERWVVGRLAWAISLIAVSLPRQTSWRLAPPPVEPWQGLAVVAIPLWGALLLFCVILALARHPAVQSPALQVQQRQQSPDTLCPAGSPSF
jgi:hypothetical protein